ncbi:clathrin assembly complex, small subunit [Halteromyces radiatus]|uniref:clathrin assembly complex, small subunit n=1 Tax=Halteromyces radiatus TaxID=101107 RepID=UPI0022209E32|nr:clathrin assembly complex, small subunit [Halteromyces radiatus]KAI8086144.1 clathrin assembly complex, small subunit [Halteromyces radiatus]
MISFVLIVNKTCQTRFAKYYTESTIEHCQFELELAKQCVKRPEHHCLFFEFEGYDIVYRPYASLYIIVGYPPDQENEFGILEWIQLFVETMDIYFDKVTELDLVFQLEKVHMILEEILPKGLLGEANQDRILSPAITTAWNSV